MNVRLQYPATFTAGVFYHDALRMNTYTARIWMTTATEEPVDHNVAYERLRYMIDHMIDSSVFIDQTDTDRCRALINAGINIIPLPSEPVDQIIGLMLYSKLNAVMQDRMIVHDIEISSTLGDGMVYLHSDDETVGPFADEGWWNDSEPLCCPRAMLHTNNVMTMTTAPTWRDLELGWKDDKDSVDIGNTIVFADFNRNESK